MDYEEVAKIVNETRKKRNQPEIPLDELIAMIKKSEEDVVQDKLGEDEKLALSKFREAEIERQVAETPLWIKLVWAGILGGIAYYFFG